MVVSFLRRRICRLHASWLTASSAALDVSGTAGHPAGAGRVLSPKSPRGNEGGKKGNGADTNLGPRGLPRPDPTPNRAPFSSYTEQDWDADDFETLSKRLRRLGLEHGHANPPTATANVAFSRTVEGGKVLVFLWL